MRFLFLNPLVGKSCLNARRHTFTDFYSPQANAQVERADRRIKERILSFFEYDGIN